jgi:hypothetical protein
MSSRTSGIIAIAFTVILSALAISVLALYLSFLSRDHPVAPNMEGYPYVKIEEATHISGRELQVPGRHNSATKDPVGESDTQSSD